MYFASTRNNIHVHLVLETPPPNWVDEQGAGYISNRTLVQHLPAPADDILLLMCGPPIMMV